MGCVVTTGEIRPVGWADIAMTTSGARAVGRGHCRTSRGGVTGNIENMALVRTCSSNIVGKNGSEQIDERTRPWRRTGVGRTEPIRRGGPGYDCFYLPKTLIFLYLIISEHYI